MPGDFVSREYFKEKTANQQVSYMQSPGSGFKKVDAQRAMAAAEAGQLVIAGWANPAPNRSGHVAAVVGRIGDRPAIAQAGRENFEFESVTKGFGRGKEVSYFVQE